ncbi:zinc-dependent alcohol dehydrogenase family protein [Paraburkholderia humisilvae]|uniref:Phenolphthiocerol synthesis polyketide synthase type I Pks15/1 n=1 Tax=Paraburkholderia humisilvae TaxID=627669 RepID=A0A6J5DS34_9BURK|nr:zinc-dependent alcohol dehydrogenase family protein [Paraburkholderia humisilvae]CAB3756427.1 Phenolphthiocerol synthesis polyketide synthase type I Pks15/1 [Paraburkholderia humisilvae]
MRALILDTYDNGRFRDANIEARSAANGELQIRVHASGVNPIDYKIRQGKAPFAAPALPAVLGTDVAGVVTEVGAGVKGFAVGDEVYGLAGGVRGLPGSLAEFMTVDAAFIAKKPANLTMREAAALPLVALTAWEGLVDRANLNPGQTVLVQGGAGGVGHVVVQIAKALGADVYATASTKKLDLVRALGATPIDYTNTTIEQYIQKYTNGKGFDIVYDTVGGDTLEASLGATCAYGHVVSCAAYENHNLAISSFRCADISGVFVLYPMLSGERHAHHGAILREIAQLAEAGKVRPVLDSRRFTFDTAMDAHRAVETGANIKVVIDVVTNA